MKTFREFMAEAVLTQKRAEDKYINGHCREFAHALHHHIGGEVKELHHSGKFVHAYVEKEGKHYDVHGHRSPSQMGVGISGRLEHWTADHPHDASKHKPLRQKSVDAAHDYIKANKRKFGVS